MTKVASIRLKFSSLLFVFIYLSHILCFNFSFALLKVMNYITPLFFKMYNNALKKVPNSVLDTSLMSQELIAVKKLNGELNYGSLCPHQGLSNCYQI
jgi:hypothetical protein